MAVLAILTGIALVGIVLWDTFETIVLPRTITRRLRLTRLFYLAAWSVVNALAGRNEGSRLRSGLLNVFGPISLIVLLGIWALFIIFGLALLEWGAAALTLPQVNQPGIVAAVYGSASTFVTLGVAGGTNLSPLLRFIGVGEAGLGLGFLAIVIGYLPVIYQSFSRREAGISLLDARAGSPPMGGELLRRYGAAGQLDTLAAALAEWERWAADMLESHLSYPVLAFYRSQHDRESWLAALTAILDACALILASEEGNEPWQRAVRWQAHLTFAMARHTAVDLVLTLRGSPRPPEPDRLPAEETPALCRHLSAAGLRLPGDERTLGKLARIRSQYEPYVYALATRLLLELPPWVPERAEPDNWQTSAWDAGSHFTA